MPNSNPDSRFSFRSLELAKYYDRNYSGLTPAAARSQAAKRDIERYQWLLAQSLPAFGEKNAIAIWSALNGCSTRDTETLLILRQGVASELDQPLQDKVLKLSLCEWLAVVDACDRVGSGAYQIDDLSSELKRVGLLPELTGSMRSQKKL